ncbi:VC0807 family protein [Pseudonocardia pini]|uniref:VC0807 family protein n=1 Tax=Pseudonocardia pini TaxID=2758030 RepID=UPI0015F0F8FE|nr:VC0807 family protein [Pseudonocardia pini]
MTENSPAASVPGPMTMLRGLALDVGLPVLAYYALHLLGASDWIALLAASAVAAVRVVWSAVRARKLNVFATVMLLVYGAGFAMAFFTGDPRTLLLRNSLITASVGTVFLVTAIRGKRPLTLAALQSFTPAKAAEAQLEYDTDPHVRRGHRFSSTVWGVGLLAEAVLRVPLVYLLPVDVAVGVTEVLFVGTFVLLIAWNGWWVARARRRGSAQSSTEGTAA